MTIAPPARRLAQPFIARLWQYQSERFPVAGLVPLISAFAFCSAAYSRLARGQTDFIPWPRYVVGAYTTLCLFFLLRVLDEHKDQEQDRRFRPELPVPRGLVTLRELRQVGVAVLAVALTLNLVVAPSLLVAVVPIAIWMTLMTKEFFVPEWLRAHPAAYLVSHMAVLPVIDVYTTGLDWLAGDVSPPSALPLFLGVTFANGVLLEIGRKVRAPSDEREGVDTYSVAWGIPVAATCWLLALAVSLTLALRAAAATGESRFPVWVLFVPGAIAALPGLMFAFRPARAPAKGMELAGQFWPLVTYLVLGGAPFVARWLGAS